MMEQMILPAPFAWIEIPAGNVTLVENVEKYDGESYLGTKGEHKQFSVPAFAIAKYPVTNAQFVKFMDAKGYENQDWWTDAGWETCKQENWAEPRYWQDSQWNGKTQPVVGVSWYEAVAFCLWLSHETGDAIMLPTEQQWQRAAQALPDGRDSGYDYPWGNDWDCQRCNNCVEPCDSNVTTPVTQYEGKNKGDSPCSVVDMAGNVWEWCRTMYQTGSEDINGADMRVLHGGSWFIYSSVGFRCGARIRDYPSTLYYGSGFRFARSL